MEVFVKTGRHRVRAIRPHVPDDLLLVSRVM